jgi:hypothetical protein
MLGGGVFVTQNKVLPGSYINIVNGSSASSNVSDRGVVAIALPIGKAVGKVIEVTQSDFVRSAKDILGKEYNSADLIALREIFKHANKVYVYDLGNGEDVKTADDVIKTLDAYEFNVLCAYTNDATAISTYITAVKNWRDNIGKKVQVVVYDATTPKHEGVINVVSKPSGDNAVDYSLVAWVAGAEAGCKINESCTNMLYDGEYTIDTNKTQTDLETCIKNGQIAFHLVYGDVRLLEDVNSLTETTTDKGEDFKYNQTIRVVDQIANDIAKMFNTKYLGKIPNNESGRVSLWGDIVAHHRKLEAMNAIEYFDATLLTVTQGDTKKSVVVNDVITVTNAMSQLYMTVVIQ